MEYVTKGVFEELAFTAIEKIVEDVYLIYNEVGSYLVRVI